MLAAGAATPSQGLFVPLASFEGLTAVEAATDSGDGRKVLFALLKETQEQIAAMPDGSRPTKMTINRGTPAGVNVTTVRQSITINFDLDTTPIDLSPEV